MVRDVGDAGKLCAGELVGRNVNIQRSDQRRGQPFAADLDDGLCHDRGNDSDGSGTGSEQPDAGLELIVGSFYAMYVTGIEIPTDWPKRVAETLLHGLAIRGWALNFLRKGRLVDASSNLEKTAPAP